MAKKRNFGRRPTGAAGIAVVDDMEDEVNGPNDADTATDSNSAPTDHEDQRERKATRLKSKKTNSQSGENVGIGDIRKAAAFANSVGGLDKAVALLQILKVAKEVQ